MTEPLIKVEGLYKIFGPKPDSVIDDVRAGRPKDEVLAETGHTVGLSDINLEIERGEIFTVMGLSGSGKSTLIRHFNRLIDPTAGSIAVDGTDVMQLSQADLEAFRRSKTSMVFQRFGLLPHRNVLDNVAFGLKMQGVPAAERNERAMSWLETVGLQGYEKQFPGQLSGGQQQRVGLARALCTDPEILLMDEAFSALDPLIRSQMQDQLIELQDRLHKTIVFITHDLDEALRLGDKIAILKDGRLSQVGRPEEILLHPADDYVESFVRDVNRARVLSVNVVMRPAKHRIATARIDEALRQMREWRDDYGFVFEGADYRGVVTREVLEKAPENASVYDVAEAGPTINPDTMLEDALPIALDTEYPLPVVSNGDYKGILSKKDMAAALSENRLTEQDSKAHSLA